MNDVNLAPENKEATPEHGYLMAYDKKEQKAKGVKRNRSERRAGNARS